MEHYRKTSHSIYDIKYHIVWITKYRKPILSGEIGLRVRELIRQICTSLDVEVLKGHVAKDHVHIMVSVPPYISVSKLVQSVKGRTSRKMLDEYKGLRRTFWGRHMWARGYFVATTGNVTDEVIMKYIEEQDKMERAHDDDFSTEP
ncbi:MAG: IS200/IS605 family transposase [Spirochaetota bacterium]|jgi:putative transposase|nr:IS200/IS605 family transposase [Spirochaetota bacterium]